MPPDGYAPLLVGDLDTAINLAHILDGHPDDRVALIYRNRPTTYGDVRSVVGRLRAGLRSLGVEPGDRVVMACANNEHFVASYLAVVGIGAIAVPVNPTSPPAELQRELQAVEPLLLVLEPFGLATLAGIDREAVGSLRHVVLTEAAAESSLPCLADLTVGEPVPIVDVDPDTTAVMMFTSGTAGSSRPAMLSHRNLLANIRQSLSAPVHIEADDVVYGVLPLFHIFGLNVMLGLTLAVGARLVLVQRFDPSTAADSIRDRGVTVLPGAPPLWVAFAHFDELPADTFSRVRIALSGASKLPPSVARTCEERFGLRISEGYGLTEAAPVVTSSAGLAGGPRYGSVGRALEGVEVRLVGPDGADVLVGDVGEILVRGENVFKGYFRDPETTARVLDDDGWLHTGDMATADDDGWLYLVDRAKDLIIVSGFNVFPAEVEEVLTSHPAVAEAGVIGVPHPHTGEAVKAFVALEPGAEIDEEALIDHASEQLARYKCPTKVLFVDELPRNISGKLVRRHLTETVLDDTA